jgi:hypothetical protein
VRFAVLLTITTACSTSAKHDDGAPMPQPPRPPEGSGSQSATPAAPSPKVYLSGPKGDVPVTVEVVATEPKIEKGLMFRQHLPICS